SDILQAVYRGDRDEAERLAAQQDLDVFEASALGDTERGRELVASDTELANAWGEDGVQPPGLARFFGHEGTGRAAVRRAGGGEQSMAEPDEGDAPAQRRGGTGPGRPLLDRQAPARSRRRPERAPARRLHAADGCRPARRRPPARTSRRARRESRARLAVLLP